MVTEGFRQYLIDSNTPTEEVAAFTALIEKFEDFLIAQGRPDAVRAPSPADINAFSLHLVAQGQNQFINYRALARYGRYLDRDEVYVTVVELVDGAEALDNLYRRVGEVLGEPAQADLFNGIDLPAFGTPSADKPPITQTVMARLEFALSPEDCRHLLAPGLRDLQGEWFLEDREKYMAAGGLDAFLVQKGADFIAQLQQIHDEDKLYFTQPITDEVIAFVESVPEIRQGLREGEILYEVKIPYMTHAYLAASDPQRKAFYYCHCPWVRESLPEGEVQVSPTFCNCSAGFHKKYWEVVLDTPLEAEVVETVLQGDPWCKFAIHLPENVVSQLE